MVPLVAPRHAKVHLAWPVRPAEGSHVPWSTLWLDSTAGAPSPPRMKLLRNWIWILAPIALFLVIVVILNMLDVGEPAYDLR